MTKLSSLHKTFLTGLSAAALIAISACSVPPESIRSEVAQRIAAPAWMLKRHVHASPFDLAAYERMHEREQAANIYIGNIVKTYKNEEQKNILEDLNLENPTPSNPVALHLASRDNADNLAYIAGPCEFIDKPTGAEPCAPDYWRSKQFSPEVISSYNAAIDNIVRRYDIKGVNLIGYGDGAAITSILATQRDDVLSLRTVAGNFAPDLLPADHDLNTLPQHHFIGGKDMVVPKSELDDYLATIGTSSCVKHTLVPEAEHDRGWVEKWPGLLKDTPPVCEKEMKALEPLDIPEPIFYPRMDPSKK